MGAEFRELMNIVLYLLLALGGGVIVAVFTILLIILIAASRVWVGEYMSLKLRS